MIFSRVLSRKRPRCGDFNTAELGLYRLITAKQRGSPSPVKPLSRHSSHRLASRDVLLVAGSDALIRSSFLGIKSCHRRFGFSFQPSTQIFSLFLATRLMMRSAILFFSFPRVFDEPEVCQSVTVVSSPSFQRHLCVPDPEAHETCSQLPHSPTAVTAVKTPVCLSGMQVQRRLMWLVTSSSPLILARHSLSGGRQS